MKQHRIFGLCLALAMLGGALVGCSDQTEDSTPATTTATTEATTEAPTEAETEASTEAPTEAPKTIGTPAEGDYIYSFQLTNATELEITSITVSPNGGDPSSANLIDASDPFLPDETRTFYLDATDLATEDAPYPEYALNITAGDSTQASLQYFPYADLKEVKLCYSEADGLGFLVYTSSIDNEEYSTLQDEQAYQQAIAEEQQAAVEQAQEEQQNYQQAQEQEQQEQEQEQPVQTVAPPQTQAPTEAPTEAPAQTEAPVATEAPATEAPAADPNAGCIGDEGLFY